jgi:RNA 2',3'-cyclic 3'-phosphodiesterase
VRLFVAIEVAAAPEPAPGSGPVDHLTLSFLGEVPADALERISATLARVARSNAPFDLVLEGVDAFPSRSRPRVLWVGASTGRAETTLLASRISAALADEGFRVERERFVPHVTLFRVRSPELEQRARALLSGAEPPPPPRSIRVAEFALVESTLTSHGAIHRPRRTFRLGAPSDAPT